MIGTRILNYEIKSLIGEGGMGAVYMAEHLQVNRKVAIKVLHPKFLKNEEIKQRFKNEAATLSHLHHPNIVGLFDYLEDETGLYLIMEYVDGVQLDDYISNTTGPMPEEKAIPLMKQILSAFAYAHEKGIVHRDIKPANIIISQTNEVKILDFGIAKILGESNNMTKTGTQMGTVYYMSPEQVQGKKADIRSDIYSLGVTFYQMLTGVNPYQSLTTEYEVYTKIVKEDLPPANQIYPGVSAYLVSILKFTLEKDPDLRFQNCTEILKALEDKDTIFEGFNTKKETPKIEKITFGDIGDTTKEEQIKNTQTEVKKKKSIANGTGIIAIVLSWIPGVNIISFFMAIVAIKEGNKEMRNAKINKDDFKHDYFLGKSGKVFGWLSLAIILIVYVIIGFLYFQANQNIDSDYDGVPDKIDNCVDEYGESTNDGCPLDSDADGVYDSEDNCINEYGPSDNNGCPYPKEEVQFQDNQSYEEPELSYKTVCPYCENVTYENSFNINWNCSCGESFYGCKQKNSDDYGVKNEWISDGECDCYDCSDEPQ